MYIRLYDVKKYTESINSKQDFWNSILEKNRNLSKLDYARQRNTEIYSQAEEEINEIGYAFKKYIKSLPLLDCKEICDSLLEDVGILEVLPDVTLNVYKSNVPNAFASFDGQIFISSALLFDADLTHLDIVGVIAHEAAHVLLEHPLASIYATLINKRNNKIAAGTFIVLNMGASVYAASQGVDTSENLKKISEILLNEAEYNPENVFRFKYVRTQEIEADLIAYRFLEKFMNDKKSYISTLRTIDYNSRSLYSDPQDSHPTTRFRIELLKHVSTSDERDFYFSKEQRKKRIKKVFSKPKNDTENLNKTMEPCYQ